MGGYGKDNSGRYSGIYAIINMTNGKVYIGQSQNVYQRRIQHFNELISGKHPNSLMQKDWNKKDRFVWKVIEMCPISKLNEREIYWIKEMNTLSPSGYNIDWKPYKRKKTKKTYIKGYHKTR